MTDESIPSGALKVAETAPALPVVASVYPWQGTVLLAWESVWVAHNVKPGPLCSLSDAQAALDKLTAERDAARSERDSLRAARIAYASEFPPDADGEPDVGSIHANIRALKAQPAINVDEAMRLAKEYALAQSNGSRIELDAAREALRAYLGGKP